MQSHRDFITAVADAIPPASILAHHEPSAVETSLDVLIILGGLLAAMALPFASIALWVLAFVE